MVTSLKVTQQTTLSDLEAFTKLAGDGAKIRGKTDRQGNVTLYASHKKEGVFDFVAKLFGGGRDVKRQLGEQAIQTILRNSSTLGNPRHTDLVRNLLDDTRQGGELRTDGLQKILTRSVGALQDQVEFNGKTYTQKKLLGSDGMGLVHLYEAGDGEKIVLKRPKIDMREIDPNDPEKYAKQLAERDEFYQAVRDEIQVHRHINDQGEHPNVVRLLGELTGPDGEPVMVLPFVPHDDSRKLTNKLSVGLQENRISEDDYKSCVFTIMQDMGNSLKHLHDQAGVLQLDVKLENYLIDAKGNLQLMDFGTSKIGLEHDLVKHPVDTFTFLPPEVAYPKYVSQFGDPVLEKRIDALKGELRTAQRENTLDTPENKAKKEEYDRLLVQNKSLREQQKVPVNKQTDSWVFGATLYKLLVNPHDEVGSPFWGKGEGFANVMMRRLIEYGDSNLPILDQVQQWYPDNTQLRDNIARLGDEEKRLVNGLLDPNPKTRMGIDEAMQSELFEGSWVGSQRIRDVMIDFTK